MVIYIYIYIYIQKKRTRHFKTQNEKWKKKLLFLDYQEFIEMKTLGLVILAISILTGKNPAKERRYGDWSKVIFTLQSPRS